MGAIAAVAVAALLGCSSAPSEVAEKPKTAKPEATAPKDPAPEPDAAAEIAFPTPAAAGDPGQSLADACALLYAGSEIHQTRASGLNLKDQEELERELPLIVADAQAQFVQVGNPEATAIATEYSKQVALMSEAMLGGEYAMTAIATAGAGVQAAVDDALALCQAG